MFFVLSKILDFVFQPICWIFLLLFIIYFKSSTKILKRICGFVILFLFILSNGYLSNFLYNLWESPYQENHSDTYPIGIVLTGGNIQSSGEQSSSIHVGEHSDRLMQSLILFKKGIIKKILISGGNVSIKGNLIRDFSQEAEKCASFLKIAGVPDTCIYVEAKSRNTYENAVFSGQYLKKLGLDKTKVLLITSSYHMRRSSDCFTKQGIYHDIHPAIKIGKDASKGILIDLIPNEEHLYHNSDLFHEIAGYLIYKIVGYC